MKQFILTFMAGVMLATSSFAMSPAYDNYGDKTFYAEDVRIAAEYIQAQQINDWNYFWNVTLNPQNTGWDEFWFQCQDPDKTTGDCVGTVFAGLGIIAGAALAITGVIVVGTAITPVAGWGGAVPAAAIFAA